MLGWGRPDDHGSGGQRLAAVCLWIAARAFVRENA
jgi:hypothetical protein